MSVWVGTLHNTMELDYKDNDDITLTLCWARDFTVVDNGKNLACSDIRPSFYITCKCFSNSLNRVF